MTKTDNKRLNRTNMLDEDIYDAEYVKGLFDRISGTYGLTNYLASFGFTERWRKQCIKHLIDLPKNAIGYDLMSGRGETWVQLFSKNSTISHLTGLDISPVMIKGSETQVNIIGKDKITLMEDDVFNNSIKSNSADFIISTFGLKTFTTNQQERLAQEVSRILKRGGSFSFVEVSNPKGWIFSYFYMFYLKKIMPVIEKLFLNYSYGFSMIAIYVENFENCTDFAKYLENAGLKVKYSRYFFGCASGVSGHKP